MVNFQYIYLVPYIRENVRLDEQSNACINQQNREVTDRTIKNIVDDAAKHMRQEK